MNVRENCRCSGKCSPIYIETAPFIYFVEEHPIYGDKMELIFDSVNSNSIEVFTSVITLTETLSKPLKTGDTNVAQVYRTLLQHTRQITLAPINAAIAESAADLRSRYKLRTPDALHLASALNAHCDAFLSNDLTFRRVTELPVIVLDELDSPQKKN